MRESAARPVALTIAGFDPTGGAGVLADCRTFALQGVEGFAAITAMTVQNGVAVSRVEPVSIDLLDATLLSLLADFRITAAKTGLLPNAESVKLVAQRLPAGISLVVDPVLASSDGFAFLDKAGQRALLESLFPKATLVTPNLPEAYALTGEKDPALAAAAILARGAKAVLIKGGHAEGPEAIDLLFEPSGVTEFRLPRHEGKSMHGSGCVLSAGITAGLAKGLSLKESIQIAKAEVHRLIGES